jgi:hypothetical protein
VISIYAGTTELIQICRSQKSPLDADSTSLSTWGLPQIFQVCDIKAIILFLAYIFVGLMVEKAHHVFGIPNIINYILDCSGAHAEVHGHCTQSQSPIPGTGIKFEKFHTCASHHHLKSSLHGATGQKCITSNFQTTPPLCFEKNPTPPRYFIACNASLFSSSTSCSTSCTTSRISILSNQLIPYSLQLTHKMKEENHLPVGTKSFYPLLGLS